MKQFYLKQLFVALFALCCMVANAQTTATVDGITYEFITEAKHATVIKSESGSYHGNIVIPETVEYNGAVYSVTAIGNNAFYCCYYLTSITIPNSVTTIESQAFLSCSGLTSISIPNSVTTIGSLVFKDCSGLTSIVVESGNTIYDSREECNAIIETATNTLVAGCSNTVIPNSVTEIDGSAFYGCTGLTSVTIPGSVTTIGSEAFGGCTSLTSITIPNSVTTIEDVAFRDCSGLTSIVVESGNTIYDSREECNAIIETATNTLVAGCKNTVIPGSVTTIGLGTFWGCRGLTNISIPSSVTTIEDYAFCYCSRLTSVTIPNSVTTIGLAAFEGSGWWNNQPDGLIYKDGWLLGYKGNEPPGDIVIADGTKRIAGYAFYHCSGLTSVTIPNSVTTIGYSAFSNCSSLRSIIIPNSVTTISSHAFYGCTGLENVTIPNSVTTIGDYAFRGCSGLTSVTIPNSVTTIGESAFSGCTSLTSITIPNSVTTIGYSAFEGCRGLTSVTIPNSVTTIGIGAFYNCTGLTSVAIPNSVTTIGAAAFYDCSSLTSVTIPNSVTKIEQSTFSSCIGLTSITIPNSVTTIGSYAFYGCSNITEIYCLATSVPSTYIYAFLNSHIETATLYVPEESIDSYKNTAPWSSFGTIKAIANDVELTYEFNATEKTATVVASKGDQYTGKIIIPEKVEYNGAVYSVTAIGDYAFRGCSGLTSVTIPNSVTTIGDRAFSGCTGLTSVTIGNSVTTIGEYAFSSCISLTSVTIPNSVTTIGSSAFSTCNNITSVTIPNSVTKIEQSTFSNCIGLTSITIPNSVTTIGGYAFYGCTGLENVTIPNSVTKIGSYAFKGCNIITAIYSYITEENLFSIRDETFSDTVYENATLHVPYGTADIYSATTTWNEFTNIVEGYTMPMSLAAVYNYVLEYANSILDDTAFSSHGLIKSEAQLSTNAQEETEGPIANLLDSDFRTYFHSTWSATNPSENGFHNLQIDLGEPLDAVALKYSKRKGTGFMTDGSPLKVRVFATNTPEGEWNEVGVHRLSYTHAINNAVVGFKVIVLDNSYRYIRLQVEQTIGNANSHTYEDNLYFNLSEFGAWEARFEEEHIAYKDVPSNLMDMLKAALSEAKSELMAGNDNEATAERLYTAFKAVKDYVPTGIEDVYDNNDTHRSNLYYDLQGRIVEHPTRGIYIHNGKKVFIK